MNKAECRKYAGEPLRVGANSGLCARTRSSGWPRPRQSDSHRQTLVLNIYSRTEAAQGNMLPKWTVFQQKDNYLTLERKEDGATSWRKACFQDLSHGPKFVSRCAFLTPADKRCVSRFFRDDMRDGFGCLTAHQRLIQENRQQVRQREKRRRINARMQSIPAIPRG